jgi:hypothetical protein
LFSRRADKATLTAILVFTVSLYLWLIYMTSWGNRWWFLDTVDNVLMLGSVDDAYRFFIIRGAFLHLSYYNWSYIFPLQLVMDGGLSWLLHHNLFVMRLIHGWLYLLSLVSMIFSVMAVTRNRFLSFSSFLLLALMPACLFISFSFYAEAWMVVIVIWLIYAFAHDDPWLIVALSGLGSLTRPGGAWFAGFIALYFFLRKQYTKAVLALTPLAIYLFWVVVSAGWQNFKHWREVFTSMRTQANSALIQSMMDPWSLFFSYGLVFFTFVALGLCNKKAWRFWPLILATAYWIWHWMHDAWMGHGKMEARYFVPIAPVLVLLWACGMEWLWQQCRKMPKRHIRIAASLIVLITLTGFLMQQAQINYVLGNLLHGRLPGWKQVEYGIGTTNPGYQQVRQEIINLVYRATAPSTPDRVDTILLPSSSSWLFYYLDPQQIPPDVTLGYVPDFDAQKQGLDILNNVYAQFGEGSRYALYDFYPPRPGEKLALYIGYMRGVKPSRVIMNSVPVYLFAYQSHLAEQLEEQAQ